MIKKATSLSEYITVVVYLQNSRAQLTGEDSQRPYNLHKPFCIGQNLTIGTGKNHFLFADFRYIRNKKHLSEQTSQKNAWDTVANYLTVLQEGKQQKVYSNYYFKDISSATLW